MKLAVLNCDEIKPSFSEKFGQYPAMFETALNNLDIRYNIVSYDIQKGIYPKNIAENHVYIITGSQSAVYEKHDWLENLFEFIREIEKLFSTGYCNYLELLNLFEIHIVTIEDLFDNEKGVLIMTEDIKIRNNRLNLLGLIRNYSLMIADFTLLNS